MTKEQIAAEALQACNACKDAGDYRLANVFFCIAFLLSDYDSIEVESDYPEDDPFSGEYDNYYDLVVVFSGAESACIPAPMLRAEILEQVYEKCKRVQKPTHNRAIKSDIPEIRPAQWAILKSIDIPELLILLDESDKKQVLDGPYFFPTEEAATKMAVFYEAAFGPQTITPVEGAWEVKTAR